MRFKFKIPLLLAALAVGVMSVSAASASAAQFLLTSGLMENVNVKASSTFGSPSVEHLQGFEISGAVSVCKKGKFKTETSVLAPASLLLVHPTYSECEAELAGKHEALVSTTGCNYVFHAVAPGTKGTVDIECESGDSIVVTVHGLTGCEIKVGPQTGLLTVEYANVTGGLVEVKANVEKIVYTATSQCTGVTSGSTGKYREGLLPPALGSLPARVLAEAQSTTGTFLQAMIE